MFLVHHFYLHLRELQDLTKFFFLIGTCTFTYENVQQNLAKVLIIMLG